jgi:HAD superfamily hydrolase (TIGR01459 family)
MGCRIIQSLSEVSVAYDAVLCDLWGCYHDGITPYAAAVDACRAFRADGGLVVLLTNAPRPAASVRRFLDQIGAPADSYDEIVSSGGACQAALQSGAFGHRVQYVGPERDLHMLTDVGLEPADSELAEAVLVTGLRDDSVETPADYAGEIAGWAARGLPMLCANPDIIVDRGEERLWCAGAIARDYEAAGGRVVWYGKPHRPIYARCFEILSQLAGREVPRRRVLAIGDGIATDVAGGIRAGLDVCFVTGGLAAGELGPDPEHPEPARLEAFLSEHDLGPRYAIGRLR